MVFKSDKQRKAVMAKLNQPNQPRTETRPTIIGRLRKRLRPTAEELAQQRGTRLQKEAEQLRQERLRVRQLELEARVESERESVRQREQTARARLTEIDRARFARTGAGRAITRGRELATVGIQRLRTAQARAPKRRKRRAKPESKVGFFGIES